MNNAWLVTQRDKRMHCHWLKQLQIAESVRLATHQSSRFGASRSSDSVCCQQPPYTPVYVGWRSGAPVAEDRMHDYPGRWAERGMSARSLWNLTSLPVSGSVTTPGPAICGGYPGLLPAARLMSWR